jgi:cytochrome P450 family 9
MNGKPVTYEALHKMKFLDQVISEVLRLHPPVPAVTRECNKDYVMHLSDGQSIPVKKGENILIPIRSIQRDEKFFKNPDKFDPHRFDDDKKDSIVQGSFIPFGEFFEDFFNTNTTNNNTWLSF